MENNGEPVKLKTARTLKWNSIDRFSTQILYAAVGIVLANVLSQSDFGIVGVILIFQAFAILFVDSGFGAALLQKKHPDQADYSTVFWFNLITGTFIYAILWFCAPWIAELFGSEELVPLSRVMFLTFIINGLGIVQTNRLMKRMDVKMIAVSNIVSLTVSGAAGIILALRGYGAWALVWQSVIQATVKSGWLWITGGWRPSLVFSRRSLHDVLRIGTGVFSSSFLNTVCLNIYSFIIGAFYALPTLGVYTQADKWSKMGTASLSQIFTATFVPLLSGYQDDREKFRSVIGKINRMSAFMVFPFMGGLIVAGEPIFHTLFGDKWDSAISLFQILCGRGIFLIFTSLYSNYILSLGKARSLVAVELVKDILLVCAIFATIGFRSIEALVWGQFISAAVTYCFALYMSSRLSGKGILPMLSDLAPYALLSGLIMCLLCLVPYFGFSAAITLILECVAGLSIYYTVLRISGSKILNEAQSYLFGRFKRK